MPRVAIDRNAPDFQLDDFNGKLIRLSDFTGLKHIILVFNRGFV
jgi:peroxiredoxin